MPGTTDTKIEKKSDTISAPEKLKVFCRRLISKKTYAKYYSDCLDRVMQGMPLNLHSNLDFP